MDAQALSGVTDVLHRGHFWLWVALYYVFSNVIGALPTPTDKSSPGYSFLYRLLNGLAANLQEAFQKKFPQAPATGTASTTPAKKS